MYNVEIVHRNSLGFRRRPASGEVSESVYLSAMSMTTIKVSTELRDRINREARERGLPAAGLIESLLDAYERRRRMESFGQAFRGADAEYWDEFTSWDLAGGALPHEA